MLLYSRMILSAEIKQCNGTIKGGAGIIFITGISNPFDMQWQKWAISYVTLLDLSEESYGNTITRCSNL